MEKGFTDTIRERLGIDLREVAGATMSGEIPLSNALVNRLIAERLGPEAALTSARVEGRESDAFVMELVPRARLVPTVRIAARIERQPDFPRDGTLVLRWSIPGIGPLGLFAAPALALFNALPPGITADTDRIVIDVAALLAARGLGDVVGFIRALRIHPQAGGFIVRFELNVSR